MSGQATYLIQNRFVRWLVLLLTWDGVLPLLVIGIPALMSKLPVPRGLIEFTSVSIPIVAFFYRLFVGKCVISNNDVAEWFRGVQRGLLLVALVLLCLLDTVAILFLQLPAGANGVKDLQQSLAIYGCYLAVMSVAMFPGWGTQSSDLRSNTLKSLDTFELR